MSTIIRGDDHMAVVTYTGNGSTQTISGLRFQPDFVWIKARSATSHHALYDFIRGPGKTLRSSTTDAETTVSPNDALVSFNSDGFTLGANVNSGAPDINVNGTSFVAWCWKASGSTVTNTDGSITSTVSANPTAGFSIVTFTDPGSTCTVGHGLGVAPDMVIVKFRDASGNWSIYHKSLGATKRLIFTTSAELTGSGWWNDTAPTSTVFTLGSDLVNSSTQVAYCFSEVEGYSKFGSYTGNGSADGPFLFCGFRPAYLLVKNANQTFNWIVTDSTRNPSNIPPEWKWLYPHLSDVENSPSVFVDYLSNGFKLRSSGADVNGNGNTMVFMAFAENPFKNALAR